MNLFRKFSIFLKNLHLSTHLRRYESLGCILLRNAIYVVRFSTRKPGPPLIKPVRESADRLFTYVESAVSNHGRADRGRFRDTSS